MTSNEPSSNDSNGRILRFRHRRSYALREPAKLGPVKGLGKYERADGADDYKHRMLINAAAFVFVAALIGAGIWLANSIASMRKTQDCVLSGRRNCAPIEVNRDRW